jgi:hypothetical protein
LGYFLQTRPVTLPQATEMLLYFFADLGTMEAGLPDEMFSNQKSKFGSILKGLGMKTVGICYSHLEYITAIRYMLWPFGN